MSRQKTVFSSKEVVNTFYGENFNEFTNIRTRYHWSGKPYYNILNGCLYKKGEVIAKRDNYLNCVITYHDYLPYNFLIQNKTKRSQGWLIKTPAKGILYRALRCAHIPEIGSNKTIDELVKASLINVFVAFSGLINYNDGNSFRYLKCIYHQYKNAFKDHKTLVNLLKKSNLVVDCEDVVWENVKIEYKDYLHPYQTFRHNITLRGLRDNILTAEQVEEINNKIYWYDNIKRGVYSDKHITWDLFKAISKNTYWNSILRRDITYTINKIKRDYDAKQALLEEKYKKELPDLIDKFKLGQIDAIDYNHNKFMDYDILRKTNNDYITTSHGGLLKPLEFHKLLIFMKTIVHNNIDITNQYLRYNIIKVNYSLLFRITKTDNDIIFDFGYHKYSYNECLQFAQRNNLNTAAPFVGNRKKVMNILNKLPGIEIYKRNCYSHCR